MPYADIDTTINKIVIQTSYAEKDIIKTLPGSGWNTDLKKWQAPLSWSTCITLRGIFGDQLVLLPDLIEWAQNERWKRVNPCLELRETLALDSGDERLYPFQRAGVEFLNTAKFALLGDDMGTGKTIQVLATLNEDLLPALVICPNNVKRSWDREARKWLPIAHPYVIGGTASQRDSLIKAAAKDPLALIIVNYETTHLVSRLAGFGNQALKKCRECDKVSGDPDLKASRCEIHPRLLNTIPFKTVVADEAHRIKDPKSKQTRAVWYMMRTKTVERRYALTGTPVANNLGDLWSIMHAIAPHEYPTKTKFIDRYAETAFDPFGTVIIKGVHPKLKDEFYSFFDPRYRRMRKSDVLKFLPEKVRTTHYVEMVPKQRKAYTELSKNLLTKLDDDVLVAKSDAALNTRLIQFSSSYAEINDKGDVRLSEPSPKLDAMEEILDELGDKQVVIAAESRQLIELAAARLDKKHIQYGMITGHIPQADRQHYLDQFQDGKLQVMLFVIKAGGTGLTMTAADTIIFLQRSWSLIENLQSEDRVHRIGSEIHQSINVIDIVTIDSIEERQIENLHRKAKILNEITRDRDHLAMMNISDSLLED